MDLEEDEKGEDHCGDQSLNFILNEMGSIWRILDTRVTWLTLALEIFPLAIGYPHYMGYEWRWRE